MRHHHRFLLLLAVSLLLASCETIGRLGSGKPSSPATADPPPAAVCAPLEAEPLPPQGVDRDALDQALAAALGADLAADLVQWRDVDWPAWARRGWLRLQQARADCSQSSKR